MPRQKGAIRLCTDRCMWAHPFTPAEDSEVFSSALEGWAKIHDRIHIWDYCVNFGHYVAPMPNMEVIAANIRYLAKHHVEGIMQQGNYQSPGGERELMRCWVIGKLLWDPTLDVWRLMHDFTFGYHGDAAPAVWKYNQLLEQAGRDHAASLASPEGGIRYPMDSEFLSKQFLDEATALFARAKATAESDEVLRRVELAELPLLYVKLCRGPEFVGQEYSALTDRFEAIASREGLTHLQEGPPDVAQKVKAWRDALRTHLALQRVGEAAAKLHPLANSWRFATDPKDEGAEKGWDKPSFDDTKWALVRSDKGSGWEAQGFADYTGAGWYRQNFEVPAQPGGKRLYLFFEAVDEDASVYTREG
ncbi:MAG: hypothetical protein COY42_04595 [Armatimonadetes bacterium CG_4_10_14_0_8_um_filter_66_14]|nr:DUF4838 domain-containing protein [Armatimonadota bacterium]PIZ49184.1 MAG: hypothetical protein COY42_04595 [Armatimonadetes bacterium CG_4_10_14_0_8_um_filter_66_14]